MTQKEFYNSKKWKRFRQAYVDERIAIDGGLCEVCKRKYGKIVHHIKWLNDDNVNDVNISMNFDNLRYECQDCHNKEVNPETKKRKIRFLPDGTVLSFGI